MRDRELYINTEVMRRQFDCVDQISQETEDDGDRACFKGLAKMLKEILVNVRTRRVVLTLRPIAINEGTTDD